MSVELFRCMSLYIFLCRTHTNLDVAAEVLPADKEDSFGSDSVPGLEDRFVNFSKCDNNCRIL